jgi:hypothetical protein
MRINRPLVAALAIACLASSAIAPARAVGTDLATADAAYAAGNFAAATTAYDAAAASDPTSVPAHVGVARMAMFRGDLATAQREVDIALKLSPTDDGNKRLAARIADRRADSAAIPFPAGTDVVAVPFVAVDPLPMVRVRANGKDAYFLIDTGAPSLVLDPDFAKELNIPLVQAGMGTFAGGKTARVQTGTLHRFGIGSLEVNDLAVAIAPARGLSGFTKRIDGIIGTRFLTHFTATIDYGAKQLVLRPRGASIDTTGASIVPMWLVGDHFIFARGHINDGPDSLMLIDTGLAGGGVMPVSTMLDADHIVLDRAHAGTGVGGGGPVTMIPFVADVTLGDATRTKVPGIYTPEGSPTAMFPFASGGIVSHAFFAPGSVTFDFANMRLIILKGASP